MGTGLTASHAFDSRQIADRGNTSGNTPPRGVPGRQQPGRGRARRKTRRPGSDAGPRQPRAPVCTRARPHLRPSAERGSKRRSPQSRCGSPAATYGGFDTMTSNRSESRAGVPVALQEPHARGPRRSAFSRATASAAMLLSVAVTSARGRSRASVIATRAAAGTEVQYPRVAIRCDPGEHGIDQRFRLGPRDQHRRE